MSMSNHRGVLLKGRSAIASYLGFTEREVDHQAETNNLPTFHLGRTVVARVESIERWIEQREGSPKQESREPVPIRPPVRRRRYA
jgi:hypothetical protein